MRIAVSGSHGTGKSHLIAALADRLPHFRVEPEAFELLADDVELGPSGEPDLEGLAALLDYTLEILEGLEPSDAVICERSPVDYLAYAVAAAELPAMALATTAASTFVKERRAAVRRALGHLDLIVLLPVSSRGPIGPRPGEDEAFRAKVDEAMKNALIGDEHGLFEEGRGPEVLLLEGDPQGWLAEIVERVAQDG